MIRVRHVIRGHWSTWLYAIIFQMVGYMPQETSYAVPVPQILALGVLLYASIKYMAQR